MAYSFVKTGGSGEAYDIIAEEIQGTIFFAGEVCIMILNPIPFILITLLIKVIFVQSLKPVSNTVKSYDDKQQMSSQHPQNPRAIFNSFCYVFWNLFYVLKYLYCLLI